MTLLTNFPSYESDAIVQANSNYFCFSMGSNPTKVKFDQVIVKQENRGDEGSKRLPWTALPLLKHWSLDLVQQSTLFREKRMTRRLMLVTPITPTFKNSFVATWPRWIPLSIVLFHTTSGISSCVGSYMMLSRLTLEWNWVLLSIIYWRTLPRFLFPLSLNT